MLLQQMILPLCNIFKKLSN